MKNQNEKPESVIPVASDALFCVTVPTGEKLGETVYDRNVIGLRWNQDFEPPRLEVGYLEKYEEHYSDHRLNGGGFREVWEEVPEFSSQNAQVDLTGDPGGPNSKKDVIAG